MPPGFVGLDPQAVYLFAGAVKLAVEDYYAADGVALPETRQIVPGTPAYDCEMLAVQAEATFAHAGSIGFPVDAEPAWQAPAHAMRFMRCALWMIRCVPVLDDQGNPPTVTDTEAAAQVVLADSVMMMNAVLWAEQEGRLPACSAVAAESWTNVEPSGGLGGGVLRVRLNLAGW